jgi:F-type H+-transporting ATPase subunit epsilon
MFRAVIMTSDGVLFEGDVWSVFLPGATGEFEVMEFHKPIVSLLKKGKIVINWEKDIRIKRGAVRMSGDELTAVVEPAD